MSAVINGAGYDNADLMIVGDYARKFDATSGKCLSGYYENKLNDCLKPANFHVSQTYRTCIIKSYIKGLGVGTFSQDKKILESSFEVGELEPLSYYIETLLDEINTIKPAVIIACGEYALRTLTGKDAISKWRGSILPLSPDIAIRLNSPLGSSIKVIPSYHIAAIHLQEELQFLIRLDFKKAIDLLLDPNKPIDYHEIHIARSSIDMLRFIEQYPIEKFREMTYDIETHRGFITCYGFSFDGYKGMTCPAYGATSYDITDRARMMYLMSQLLAERDVGNQNIGYDKRISTRFGMPIPTVVWDTMLAQHTIAAEFPKDLGFLTSIYTDMSYYKMEGREFDPSKQSYDVLYNYNCKDAISTFQIWQKQKKELRDMDLYEFFTDYVMKLFDLYYELESIGIKIDISKRDDLISKYQGLYNLKELELFALTQTRINLNSPTQIGKYMEAGNFPVYRHRVDSGFMVVNTDVESLQKMLTADPMEYRKCSLPYEQAKRFIQLILLLRRINKVLEYVNVGIHPWGRVHTSVKIGGTTSSRTSQGKCADQWPVYIKDKKDEIKIEWENLGQSFQTVTKHGFIIEGEDDPEIEDGIIGTDIREMYIPDPEMVFVEADLSQSQARIVDVLCEDWEGLVEYGKLDKHTKVASYVFGKTYEELIKIAKGKGKTPEGEHMRFIGKKGKHSTNFDAGAYRLALMANITTREASVVLNKIHKAYPSIREVFHKGIERCVRDTRKLFCPSGRIRMFFKKIEGHGLKVAYSYLPQAIEADHMKGAMLTIKSKIDPTKAWLVVENHDSMTGLVRKGYLRQYCSIVKEAMEKPINFNNCSLSRDYELIIPAEFSIGRKNWGQMKEIKQWRYLEN